MVKISDKDNGAKALARNLKALSGSHVRVGIQGKEASAQHAGSPSSVAAIATYQEFGTSTIPERSFIRATVDEKHAEIQLLIKRLAKLVAEGKLTEDDALKLLGQKVQADIINRIRDNIPPPLKEETIQRKGSSVALIDTGQMVQAITYRVVPKTEGDSE